MRTLLKLYYFFVVMKGDMIRIFESLQVVRAFSINTENILLNLSYIISEKIVTYYIQC